MKRVTASKILKPGGSVMTTRQILSYIKQFKGTPLSIKLKKALVQMRKLKIGSAKIEIDPKLLNHAFMPESTSYEEMVGLYGVEEHDAPLDGTAKKGTFFAEVSRRILKKIKEGVLPWQAGWKSTKDTRKGEPVMFANYITNKNYRGVNFVMCMMFGGGDRYFLTKNQITERGGKLTPGATGVPICYFIKTKKTHTVEVVGEKGEKEVVEYNEYLKGMLYYIAYPLSQTEGVKEITRQTVKVDPEKEFKPLAIAEKIVSSYPPKAPPISNHGDRAFYTPTYDTVTMPVKKAFKNEANYYSVLFHELIHSTGHPKRLNRLVPASFGSKKYAAEELVAELGASFLTAICGIDYHTLNNSAAYLAGWAQKLTNEINQDKTFFVRTQFAAIKAAKYMMGAFYKEWEKEPKKKPVSKKKEQPTAEPKPVEKPQPVAKRIVRKIQPGFKRNSAVKASIQAAITDILSTNKFDHFKAGGVRITPMLAQMLYSDFKDGGSVKYNDLGEMKQKMYEKIEYFLLDFDGEAYSINEWGQDLIDAIKGRLHTLRNKKAGTDLFPELAGIQVNLNDPAWFPKYLQFRHKPKQAIKHLLKVKRGDCIAALHREGVGDIDIPWGMNDSKTNIGFGLKHIVEKHGKEIEQLGFKVENFIPIIIQFGIFNKAHSIDGKMVFESEYFRFIIQTNKHGKDKNWLLSAFDLRKKFDKKTLGMAKTVLADHFTLGTLLQGTRAFEETKVQKPVQKSNLSGIGEVISAENLIGITHETIKLQGIWKDWIGEPATNFDMMLSGSPGSGKSTLLLQFANVLANEHGKKVLFVSKEEFGSATLSEKIDRLKIKGVHFTNTMSKGSDLGNEYDVVFLDSITNLRFEAQDYRELREKNPNIAFILILQQTKANKFKGNNEWPHEVEIVTEVDNGEAIATKNRYSKYCKSIKIPNYN